MGTEPDASSSRALHHIQPLLRSGLAKKVLLIAAILCLAIVPIMLISRGLDPERIATYGYAGVFLASFVCAASIFLPTGGFMVVIVAAAFFNPIWVALAAAAGGALGEFTSYVVGYWGRAVIEPERWERYHRAERWMRRYGSVAIFLFALVPGLIDDLIAIAAGALRFPFWKFLVASFAGRLPGTFLEAYLGWLIVPHIFGF